MSARSSLPSLLESFFRHRMMKQRNSSEATIASYRDGLRLLILFAAGRTQQEPCALTVADLDRDLVLAFLDDLETKRQNAIQTRNRIASPEMLPEADPLPHVTCSRAACLGSGDGADQYGNTG